MSERSRSIPCLDYGVGGKLQGWQESDGSPSAEYGGDGVEVGTVALKSGAYRGCGECVI